MMIDEAGLTARAWWVIAFTLGVLAGVSWFTTAKLMAAPDPITRELGLWLAAAVTCTVFSAACAVLCGVKVAARRAVDRLETSDPG